MGGLSLNQNKAVAICKVNNGHYTIYSSNLDDYVS